MPRADFRFAFPKRVRYAEVDPQQVVFNSRPLEYLDIGITEYWRAVGIPMGSLESHVARSLIEYRKPIRLDEMIDICVRTARIGRSSLVTRWEIHGAGADDLRVEGEMVGVRVDIATNRPMAVPEDVVALFEAYEGRSLRQEPA